MEFGKCNYDAGWLNANTQARAGWIFRDSEGNLKGAYQTLNGMLTSSLEAEFQALILAMQSAWLKGYRRVIFEGDSKQLLDLVESRKTSFRLQNWVRDVWYWKTRFDEIRIAWVPREDNKVADTLTKTMNQMSSNYLFHYYVPIFIVSDLLEDHLASSI